MGDTPSAPTPPDPIATSSAQGTANVATSIANTAQANANVYTPEGSSTYAQTGYVSVPEPDGSVSQVPTYTNTQTLSPGQQQLYNKGVQLGNTELTDAQQLANNAGQAIQTPIAPSAPLTMGVNSGVSGLQYQLPQNAGQIQTSIPNNSNQIQTRLDNNGNQIQTGFNNYNSGILQQLGANSDNSEAVNRTIQAQLQLLQPTVSAQNQSLQAQLASQGIAPGSQAWTTAMTQQGMNVNNLNLAAVAQGNQEQQALYGEQLSSGQFQNAADAQMYGQATGAEQNANAALGQQFQQRAATGAFANAALAQQFGQNAQAAGFTNAALGQQFGQYAQAGQFANSANAQAYNQGMGAAQFGNQAIGQDLSQQAAVQNQSINEAAALMHGGQVSQPSFQPYQSSPSQPAPVSQDTYASAQLAEQQYQAQLQANAAEMGGMFSMGGSALGALASKVPMFGSDPDLKDDHGVVGMLADLPVHAFNYKGDDTSLYGFMADEVEHVKPEAVRRMKNGYRAVDYGRILADG